MEVQTIEMQDSIVLGVRRKGRYSDIGKIIGELCQYAESRKIGIVGPPAFLCHESGPDSAKKANDEGIADVEVVIPVEKKIRGSKGVKCYSLEGGLMAKIMHKGPYSECAPAYGALFSWIAQNGRKSAGPTRELYLTDPSKVLPEENLTEIYVPIS